MVGGGAGSCPPWWGSTRRRGGSGHAAQAGGEGFGGASGVAVGRRTNWNLAGGETTPMIAGEMRGVGGRGIGGAAGGVGCKSGADTRSGLPGHGVGRAAAGRVPVAWPRDAGGGGSCLSADDPGREVALGDGGGERDVSGREGASCAGWAASGEAMSALCGDGGGGGCRGVPCGAPGGSRDAQGSATCRMFSIPLLGGGRKVVDHNETKHNRLLTGRNLA